MLSPTSAFLNHGANQIGGPSQNFPNGHESANESILRVSKRQHVLLHIRIVIFVLTMYMYVIGIDTDRVYGCLIPAFALDHASCYSPYFFYLEGIARSKNKP